MFVILPAALDIGFAREASQKWHSLGKSLPDGFRFGSDTNQQWLSMEQILEIVAPFEVQAA
jgi:hypothetical protein